ncbi:BON domain-containing protein [Rheinheimera sediminis]|uniref:BON domain-containing protein n=1 Tax=Rheinheimera sp. YQF-1 TaxID=2499626 RepID=UPI001648C5F2|nr:BON domain-containing protein [Rheinheimera sp. YQF-1]
MKSDQQLTTDIEAELRWDSAVESDSILVLVHAGIVTLSGRVSSLAELWHAQSAVHRVYGVQSLDNQLVVSLPHQHVYQDVDLTRVAEAVLQWSSHIPPQGIELKVAMGWIYLTGEVAFDYQRRAATEALCYLAGVRGVTNEIRLTPKNLAGSVKKDIETALARQSRKMKSAIEVEVIESDVVLTGTVNSWSEHDKALVSVWSTPGVSHVTDHIYVL